MGILTHSVVFLIMNEFFWVVSDSEITSVVELRFALRGFAETLVGICLVIFTIGCIVMAYPSIAAARHIRLRNLIVFFAAVVMAMLFCSIPFGIADKHFDLVDYLLPVFNGIIVSSLYLIVILLGRLVSVRKTQENSK
jgi:hypothetical protein